MMRTLSDTLNGIILTRITDAQQKDAIRNINPILKPLSLVIIAVSTSLSVLGLGTAAKATTFEFDQKLLAPDGATDDRFGSVSIDGNFVLIGAPADDDNGGNSGSAYLFDVTTGNLLQKFIAPDGAGLDNFGGSVSINGNLALISAGGDDDNGFNSGSAYLFDTTTGNLLQKFLAPDGAAGDTFGSSVSINGNFALIGASSDDDNGSASGSAYLFDVTTGDLLQKFIAPDGAASDQFGRSVAMNENLALIGAFADDDNGTNSGSAYLFDVNNGDLVQKFTAPDAAAGDTFGISVAMDENLALIGSFLDDDNGTDSGSAYLFDVSNGNLLQKFLAPDAADFDGFGSSVAINGNNALIATIDDDDNGIGSGSAYLFDTTTGSFVQKFIAPDGAANDRFGNSVAIDGNNILIGSFFDDDNGDNSGSAYLFTVESVPPESVPEPSSIIGIVSLLGLGALIKKR